MKITLDNIDKDYYDSLNHKLIQERNLGEETPSDKYFELLNSYRNFLEQFLKELLPLELIDTKFKESDLGFSTVKEEDKDFYQMYSNMGLSYMYLRNNVYIENLTDEELEFLSSKKGYDKETKEFIKNTCTKVVNPHEDNKIIFYGPENGKFLCNSNDLVIGIRYDEFNDNVSDNEFEEKFLKKQRLVSQICTVVEAANSNENINIRCIQYNEFSVKKNETKQM